MHVGPGARLCNVSETMSLHRTNLPSSIQTTGATAPYSHQCWYCGFILSLRSSEQLKWCSKCQNNSSSIKLFKIHSFKKGMFKCCLSTCWGLQFLCLRASWGAFLESEQPLLDVSLVANSESSHVGAVNWNLDWELITPSPGQCVRYIAVAAFGKQWHL